MLAPGFALCLLAASASAPAAAGVSLAQAEALEAKLARAQAGLGAPRAKAPAGLTVTAEELNSYVAYKLRSKMPPEVSDLRVAFERDRLTANALVDFDRLKAKMPPLGPFNPLTLLSGRVPAELRGRLDNGDGFGTFQLEDARLGAVPIPVTVIEQAVARSTRTAERPQGVDLAAPFRLPWGIRRVRLQPGRALIEY
jgi:hypothetical protein